MEPVIKSKKDIQDGSLAKRGSNEMVLFHLKMHLRRKIIASSYMFLTLANHLKQLKYMYSEIVTRKFKMPTKIVIVVGSRDSGQVYLCMSTSTFTQPFHFQVSPHILLSRVFRWTSLQRDTFL